MGRLVLVLALVLIGATAGCTRSADTAGGPSNGPPAGPIPSTAPGAACLTDSERSGVIRFASDNGASIAGVVLGHPGPVGLVLAHQSSSDLCDWVPYGRILAGLGYTVLAIDLNGYGASSPSAGNPNDAQWDHDVVAAAGQLRKRGVGRLVLMGASVGGTTVVAAAARLTPAPAAVVDLSGPEALSGVDALAAAPHVSAPILFLAAQDDPFATEVRAVHQATRAAGSQLDIIPGASHGVALLDPARDPAAAQVSATIQSFVRQHTAG